MPKRSTKPKSVQPAKEYRADNPEGTMDRFMTGLRRVVAVKKSRRQQPLRRSPNT